MWDRRAEYLGNHDGDTVRVNLDQGFGEIKESFDVRLLGVYCPELSEPGGPECQKFVAAWFKRHKLPRVRWSFVVITARMKRTDREETTLSGYVGTITSLDGTANLNAEISEFVRSRGYGGGTGSQQIHTP